MKRSLIKALRVPGARPTEAHKRPCRHCPSALGEQRGHDPEAQDFLDAYARGELAFDEVTFPCAWNPAKLCCGAVQAARRVRP